MSLVSPTMRAGVGSQIARRVSHRISAGDIRRWAIAVYWPEEPPMEFVAEDEALVAPEEFNPFAWHMAENEVHPAASAVSKNDPDRTEKQLGIDGPGLRFMLNGGMKAVYGERMRMGDVITSVVRLGPYTEREGRHGPMLISITVDTWTNQRGQHVKTVESTLIRY